MVKNEPTKCSTTCKSSMARLEKPLTVYDGLLRNNAEVSHRMRSFWNESKELCKLKE
jgi:hypothetical protein